MHPQFEAAVEALDRGDTTRLRDLLQQHSDLANSRDEGNASLLVRLIDWPGHRPNAPESARILIEAGIDVDARRDEQNGTALAGALCTQEFELVGVLLEGGADLKAPLGWMEGTNLDLADRMCQDLGRQRDEKIIMLAEMVSKAAGSKIPSRAPFGGTVPLLFVASVQAGLDFYKKLGFYVVWMNEVEGSEPYVCISRGSTEFHLTDCNCDDKRHTGNLWLRVECDLVDDLYAECQAAELKTLGEPTNQPWGFREFELEDPDGNRFTFFGPTTE